MKPKVWLSTGCNGADNKGSNKETKKGGILGNPTPIRPIDGSRMFERPCVCRLEHIIVRLFTHAVKRKLRRKKSSLEKY
jgi:hypothetical protein